MEFVLLEKGKAEKIDRLLERADPAPEGLVQALPDRREAEVRFGGCYERETEKEEIQKIHISMRGISEKKRRGEKRKYRVEKRL